LYQGKGGVVPGRDQQRLPLPAGLSPAELDFYVELRRLVDAAGLTCRALEKATSSPPSASGERCFYSKSRWGRWINGQSQPERKAIKKLAEKLAGEEIGAGRLLDLWDKAFAPPIPQPGQPVGLPQVPAKQPTEDAGITGNGEHAGRTHGSAAGKLASLVARECAAELNDRVLQGWEPLAVTWRPYTGQNADPEAVRGVPPGGVGDIGPLTHYLQSGHRLVVLGPGGAGKTTLATLLMAELLANRRSGDPVPVMVPAGSLTPGEMVKSWLERTLGDRYPSLRDARAYGPDAISHLVAQHCVLPVIDGLDDLRPGPRAQLLDALGRAFGRSGPLIMTCRTNEYHEAVESSGHVMPSAAIIGLLPVAAEEAARFLERGTAGPRAKSWQPVIAAIRSQPAGPLAKALSSPLMTGLVRSAYTDSAEMAAGLTGPNDQAMIENRILQGLIGARFSSRATSEDTRPEQPWGAPEADRWLTFLATHLASLRTYDLDWVRLRYALPAFATPVRRAALAATLAWVLTGMVFGLSRGLAFGARQGLLGGLGQGLDAALIVGAIYLLVPLSYPPGTAQAPSLLRLRQLTCTPVRTAAVIPAAYALESGLRDGIGAARAHGIATGILLGLTASALNWLLAAALIWLATRSKLFNLAEKPVYFSLRVPGRKAEFARTLTLGLAWGAGLGFAVGYGVKILSSTLAYEHPLWGLGIPAGAVIGAAFALIQWGRTPAASAPAASPLSVLRADRNMVLLLAAPFLIAVPALFGAAFASGPANPLHGFIRFGLYGLGIGLTIWLAIALSHAWPQYLITSTWLAATGKLPWRLAAFLAEAHNLRILRQHGGAYQFRHARLQDHLARTPPCNLRAPTPPPPRTRVMRPRSAAAQINCSVAACTGCPNALCNDGAIVRWRA
jgi:NACHT domain